MKASAPSTAISAAERHNVRESGLRDGQPILFAHGFGCDQTMWRHVAPAFAENNRVIVFDHAGSGGADPSAIGNRSYSRLDDYAEDVLEICRDLGLEDVIFVGHSVSSMIGVLAANAEPERFARLVLVTPSPRYIDGGGYRGGFSREDIGDLLETMETDYLGWSSSLAPIVAGSPDQPEVGEELEVSFCRTDRAAAKNFARVTFLSDNREDLAKVTVPTLILQCSDDVIAPEYVGTYVHEQIPDSELRKLEATGHCPHLSAPGETVAAIRAYLGD